MCGITGFWLGKGDASAETYLRRMNDKLRHRGPDAGDVFLDKSSGVGLGHRRLAIIDLSESGAQPMTSPSGRYTVVFNGEIYNYERLRTELGPTNIYRGHSDTEVMLHGFEKWGIEQTIPRLFGMFAIAVWDGAERRLVLVRDRLGKKPLYYGVVDGALIFGSELKALREFPAWQGRVDRSALTSFLRHNYIPAPHSIYQDVKKLPPGSIVTFSRPRDSLVTSPVVAYWEVATAASTAQQAPFSGSLESAIDELDALLRDAVALRMVADVPLGAFLSGGVDSSLIVALMQAQSSRPVRTYTVGFSESEYDESHHAKAVAAHLGTDHTEMRVQPTDALALIPDVPRMFDEPFADSSQLPTALVCAMARKHVTVTLSGDGGDEGFCGYGRYRVWQKVWQSYRAFPGPVRQLLAATIPRMPTRLIDALVRALSPLLPSFIPRRSAGERLQALAKLAANPSPSRVYRRLISHWAEPEEIVLGGRELNPHPLFGVDIDDVSAFIQHLSVLDASTYLPDDILVKVDRASMAVGLEARSPLLDHRVLEFAWSLPLEFKFERQRSKRILWELLGRYVPRELVDRPKTGFGAPIDHWLRGPLRDWAESLLSAERLKREGYFDPTPIRQVWGEHLSGTRDWHYHLWDILMFQAWLDNERVPHA